MLAYDSGQDILAIDWTHDGYLVVLTRDGQVELCQPISGIVFMRLVRHDPGVTSLACHPLARAIAMGKDLGMLLCHPGISRRADLDAELGTPTRVAWSPGGEQLAVGTDRGAVVVIVRDSFTVVAPPRPRKGYDDDFYRVRDLVWSPSGDLVAWTETSRVYVAPIEASAPQREYDAGGSPVIAWGPTYLAMGGKERDHVTLVAMDSHRVMDHGVSWRGVSALAWGGPHLAIGERGGVADEIWWGGDPSRRSFCASADDETSMMAWSRCGGHLARVQGTRVVIDALRDLER